MKFIIFTFLLVCQYSFSFAGYNTDSTAHAGLRDSVSAKLDLLLHNASFNTPDYPKEAIQNYRDALILNKHRSIIWEADIRLEMAKLMIRTGSKEALSQLLKADELYKKGSSLYGRADALYMMAKFHEKNSLFDEAQKTYMELYKVQQEAGEFVLAGNTVNYLADYHLRKLNYTEAFNYAALAKNAYYHVCRRDSLGSVYFKIATIKRIQKKPKLAEYYIISHALPYYSSADDFKGRARSFDFLGHLYQDQKRFSQAKWFYIQSNTEARRLKDTAGTITSLINIGIVKLLIGDVSLAKTDLAEAEQLSKEGNFGHILAGFKLRYPTLLKKVSVKTESINSTGFRYPVLPTGKRLAYCTAKSGFTEQLL